MGNPEIHPVDEVLPAGKLTLLGIQHVLVMYAGAVAVPLIIGGALKLPKDQVALLINADLFACGLVTLLQAVGVWRFGIRMPVMMVPVTTGGNSGSMRLIKGATRMPKMPATMTAP